MHEKYDELRYGWYEWYGLQPNDDEMHEKHDELWYGYGWYERHELQSNDDE